MKVLVGRKRKEKKKEGEKNEENIKSQRAKSQDRKTPENQTCELRGRGGGGATKSFFALEEGRIACHPTCSSKNPITRLRLYLVNDKSPSLSFVLVLGSRMGCRFIAAPMVTASEQQSLLP